MTQRREFIGRLIVAGPTRTVTGEDGGLVVTAAAIREAIAGGLFRGLACFADHAVGGASSVRQLLGVWRDVRWDAGAGAAVGRLAAYETDETRPVLALLEQWLGEGQGGRGDREKGSERADVGVSLVFYPRLAADGRTVSGIAMIESADVVMFPASAGSRIVGKVTSDERRSVRPRTPTSEEGAAVAFGRWGKEEREQGGKGVPVAAVDSYSQSHDMRTTLSREAASPDSAATPSADGAPPPSVAVPPQDERPPLVNGADLLAGDLPTRDDTARPTDGAGRRQAADPPREAGAHAEGGDTTRRGTSRPRRQSARALSLIGTEQERDMMAGEMNMETVRRVELVRGEAQGPSESASHLNEWLEALRASAAEAVIRASGLPPVVQERLSGERYETAGDVNEAIDRARAELASLREADVVRLDGMRPSSAIRLRDGLEEARELVAFFFGAAGAPTPPANLRSFANLYVALTGDVHFRGVFDGGRVLFSGATTSTLPNLAVDAMNRVIAEQFAALDHYRWYERVTDVAPNDGRLHDMKWITLGGIGNLPAVNEGAAYTELSVADAQETASFVKRGGYVGITREMIKNGDIMQLQAIPRALAAAAVRTRSAAVSALFTANSGVGPTLAQDSKALFHLDHSNLATTALGADATAWRAARSECFQQAELGSGKPLGIFPRFLLVPAELYDTALSILGYGEGMPTSYSPEAQSRGFADPRPVPLVVPDWTDATDWAYIVDPALFPVIQMSYSQAPGGRRHPIPELFAVVSETSGLMFSNDVLPIKVRDEFAVGVNGPRGIGKRNVA